MDDEIALQAANSVRTALETALENVLAPTVTIRRDQAILALGLISAMVEMISADNARRARPVV